MKADQRTRARKRAHSLGKRAGKKKRERCQRKKGQEDKKAAIAEIWNKRKRVSSHW